MGPRRTLQLALIFAAGIALLLALTGVFSASAAPVPVPAVVMTTR